MEGTDKSSTLNDLSTKSIKHSPGSLSWPSFPTVTHLADESLDTGTRSIELSSIDRNTSGGTANYRQWPQQSTSAARQTLLVCVRVFFNSTMLTDIFSSEKTNIELIGDGQELFDQQGLCNECVVNITVRHHCFILFQPVWRWIQLHSYFCWYPTTICLKNLT